MILSQYLTFFIETVSVYHYEIFFLVENPLAQTKTTTDMNDTETIIMKSMIKVTILSYFHINGNVMNLHAYMLINYIYNVKYS